MTALYQKNTALLNEVDDFEYKARKGTKNQVVIVGISNKGLKKIEGASHIEISFPEYDETGKNQVTEIGGRFTQFYLVNDAISSRTISIIDGWKNILTIGNYAFSGCKFLSIPDNWGKVLQIANRAFLYSKFQNLPDDWGEVRYIGDSAFESCKIRKLPDDFGQIHTLGSRSFYNTMIEELPEDFGNIRRVGNNAFGFCKNLKKVPKGIMFVEEVEDEIFAFSGVEEMSQTWGTFTKVPNGFLSHTKIKKIPRDWGNIEIIGTRAFEGSRVSFIPQFWGKVHKIEKRAFMGTEISLFPDDWTGIQEVGTDAFSECRNIEELPRGILFVSAERLGYDIFRGCSIREVQGDWGELTFIPKGFLRQNPLFTIPDTWGSVTSILEEAFYECFLKEIPKDWGNVAIVQAWAFSINRIVRVPEDFSNIIFIGPGAFSCNMIDVIPDIKGGFPLEDRFSGQGGFPLNRSHIRLEEAYSELPGY